MDFLLLLLVFFCREKVFSTSLQMVVSFYYARWVENPMIPQYGRQQKLIQIYLLFVSFSLSLFLFPNFRFFLPSIS
jgi:hypothetical protein